jgi:hypothetical protein
MGNKETCVVGYSDKHKYSYVLLTLKGEYGCGEADIPLSMWKPNLFQVTLMSSVAPVSFFQMFLLTHHSHH